MAAEAKAGERVYDEIKKQVLQGKLRLRERLDVDALAKSLRVSATPVRQALAQLAAERLVKASPRGYHVALWSERELKALYEWRGHLALLALETASPSSELKATARLLPYEQAVYAVFRSLEANANDEVRRAALNADERLSAARLVEEEVLEDTAGELKNLVAAICEGGKRAKALLKSYHRRRFERADAIRKRAAIRALPPNGE